MAGLFPKNCKRNFEMIKHFCGSEIFNYWKLATAQFAIRKLQIIVCLGLMRKHNGMRPQDIVILLKIISKKDKPWQNKDLAKELIISPSEISESLGRSALAGLFDSKSR
jgi:predicted transcriptional regulator